MSTLARRVVALIVGVASFAVPATAAHSLWSATGSATVRVTVQPPAAPEAPVLQCGGATDSGPGFTLTWNATGESYTLLRSANSTTGFTEVVSSIETTTYTETTLPQNGKYYYRIRAYNGPIPAAQESNTVYIERSGKSAQFKCGTP